LLGDGGTTYVARLIKAQNKETKKRAHGRTIFSQLQKLWWCELKCDGGVGA